MWISYVLPQKKLNIYIEINQSFQNSLDDKEIDIENNFKL